MYVHVYKKDEKDHLFLKRELYFLPNIHKIAGEIHTLHVDIHTWLKGLS